MDEPHEVADEEHEQIVARVAAVDVAKASGMVCTRVPHESRPGRRLSQVWNVAATTNAVTERGIVQPSVDPPQQIRQLRDYTRLSVDLTNDRSRVRKRMEKLLEDALIKLSTVATDIFGVSGRAMIEALIAGERDPRRLAALAKGRMRIKQAALVEALTGRFDEHHAWLARMLLDQHDALTTQIDQLTTRIDQAIAAIPAAGPPQTTDPGCDPETGELLPTGVPALERLDEIPGIAQRGAQIILAEIGFDMSRFPTPEHLVSWAKLSPRTIQSGTKDRTGKTGKGNPYLKGPRGDRHRSRENRHLPRRTLPATG